MTASDEIEVNVNNEKREIGQYWEINNGGASLYVVVMGKDRCMVHFFEPNRNAYLLNDILEFEVLLEEFVWNLDQNLGAMYFETHLEFLFLYIV